MVVGDDDTQAIRALYRRSDSLGKRLIAACRPGAAAADLFAAYEAAGEPLPATPVAYGRAAGLSPAGGVAGHPAHRGCGASGLRDDLGGNELRVAGERRGGIPA